MKPGASQERASAALVSLNQLDFSDLPFAGSRTQADVKAKKLG